MNTCVITPKTVLAPPVTTFAIPASQMGIFTAGVQQDFGVNPSNTAPQADDDAAHPPRAHRGVAPRTRRPAMPVTL